MSHAGYLRDHWLEQEQSEQVIPVVRRVIALGDAANQMTTPELAAAIAQLPLPELQPSDQALVRMSLQLAARPGTASREGVASLRAQGFSDELIHDAVHVVACFGYMNRLADGLGVSIEPHKQVLAEELYGQARTAEHLAWSQPSG